jgi:histidinol phosphatase-like enzyme
MEHAIDVPRSYMVGDRDSDLGFAHNAGLRGILLGDTPGALADFPAAAQQILRELHAPR